MEAVLLTGGAGFIGSNIAEALIHHDYRVVILDDLSSGRIDNVKHLLDDERMKFVKGSILDEKLMRSLIESENISMISHQAALASVEESNMDPVKTTEVNVTGSVKLMKQASECGCKRTVFASSCAVYGDIAELPLRETMPLNPKSPYAASKAAVEGFAKSFCEIYKVSVVGFRYFNVYGKRQNPSSAYAAVIPKFIAKALGGETITIEGNGLQTRDFVYIEDVVDANIKALRGGGVSGKVYNIACGKSMSILDLAKLIIEITKSKSRIEYAPPRPGDVRVSLADIGMAGKYLDYQPGYDIKRGLVETVKWFQEQGMQAFS